LMDDTLVIFTTDHGTMLAEHDYWMKNFMPMYNEIVRIPLIMRLPGAQKSGTRNSCLTQTIDLMPTVLDHFNTPVPPNTYGHSLLKVMQTGVSRNDAIFGYFGISLNITDGRHVYMRNPVNDDGGPLYAYTAMPTGGLNNWYPRDVYDKVEMGRYFGHTYNLPLYKIPVSGSSPRPHPSEASYVGRHQLYDIISDAAQQNPLSDPDKEAHFASRIGAHLHDCEATEDQYLRLGLEPR